MQTGAATKENSMEVPAKINIELPYDLVIPILGIYSKKHKTLIRENTFTPMVIAALFTTAKIWKQPKHSSIEEWMKKMWNAYTMEY